jgi:ribose/xylose/arabinose/galactoside ABC-type transport system permease subunit/ABC-type branched-subunit amino acid transport system ATPase component
MNSEGSIFQKMLAIGTRPERAWDATNRIGLGFLCIAMILGSGIFFDRFFTVANAFTIILNVTALGIGACGTSILLISGNVDLSIGGMYALTSVSSALVAFHTQNAFLGFLTAIFVGLALGFINGRLVRALKINPLIVTIGMGTILTGLAYVLTNARTVFGFPDSYSWVGRAELGPIPIPVIIFATIIIGGGYFLLNSVVGLRLYATGGNPVAADFVGISSNKVVMSAFVLNGLLIGLVAFITTSRIGSASPSMGNNFALNVLTAAILGGVGFAGGKGHPFGVFIGVSTIGVLNAVVIFAGVPDFWQSISQGAVLVLALTFDQMSARRRDQVRVSKTAPVADSEVKDLGADIADSVSHEHRRRSRNRSLVPALQAFGLEKSFGSVSAVRNVTFMVMPGEVVCLLGDNGAGKSTVIKILSGAIKADNGRMEINGQPVTLHSPHDARAAGIQTTYQDLALCPNLGASYNLILGSEPRRRDWGVFSLRDDKRALEIARQRLAELGIKLDDYDLPIGLLSGGQRQSVAIARVATNDVKVVILDEPTAALGVKQTSNVLALVRRLAKGNAGIIFISHDIETIFKVADRVVVLRLGEVVFEGDVADVDRLQLLQLMAGATPPVPTSPYV